MCDLLIRLSKELQQFKQEYESNAGSLISELGPNLDDPESDPLVWFAMIKGPEGSPYENGTFRLKITVPDGYPDVAPKVEFLTPIFHPNVQNGNICLDLLEAGTWNAKYRIETLVGAIV
jgi:ubiquitin-protein ligase